MQQSTHPFLRLCLKHLPLMGPVYEFGALDVHDGDRNEDLSKMIRKAGFKYVGCDMRAGPGVDQVQNLHHLDIPDASIGTVISMDTLEHVEFPRKAMSEISRVLHPDGIAIMSSVFAFPIHGYPDDFWRFTPNGFRSLFKDFAECRIFSYGTADDNPQVVVGVGFKSPQMELSGFEKSAENWQKWFTNIARRLHEEQK